MEESCFHFHLNYVFPECWIGCMCYRVATTIWNLFPSASLSEREKAREWEREQTHAEKSRDKRQSRRELSAIGDTPKRGLTFFLEDIFLSVHKQKCGDGKVCLSAAITPFAQSRKVFWGSGLSQPDSLGQCKCLDSASLWEPDRNHILAECVLLSACWDSGLHLTEIFETEAAQALLVFCTEDVLAGDSGPDSPPCGHLNGCMARISTKTSVHTLR